MKIHPTPASEMKLIVRSKKKKNHPGGNLKACGNQRTNMMAVVKVINTNNFWVNSRESSPGKLIL